MDVKLPHLGEGADSGTVVNLFVKEGDQIARDQAILELENEKAVATIPSTGAGTVTKVFVKAGEKISVGQRILSFNETGAAPSSQGTPKSEAKPTAEPAPAPAKDVGKPQAEREPAKTTPGVPPPASPSLRKLAGDLGIDLTRISGSERG